MFARYVLRLELIARHLDKWDLRVGEKKGDNYVFAFRDVTANAEGGGASGNPFEDTDLSNEDEKEKEAKQRDNAIQELLTKVDAAFGSGVSSKERSRFVSTTACTHSPRRISATSIRSDSDDDVSSAPSQSVTSNAYLAAPAPFQVPPDRMSSAAKAMANDLEAKLQAMHDTQAAEISKLQAQMGELLGMVSKLTSAQ